MYALNFKEATHVRVEFFINKIKTPLTITVKDAFIINIRLIGYSAFI